MTEGRCAVACIAALQMGAFGLDSSEVLRGMDPQDVLVCRKLGGDACEVTHEAGHFDEGVESLLGLGGLEMLVRLARQACW